MILPQAVTSIARVTRTIPLGSLRVDGRAGERARGKESADSSPLLTPCYCCRSCQPAKERAKLLDGLTELLVRIAVAKIGRHPQPVRRCRAGRIGHGHLKLEGRLGDIVAVRGAGPDEVPVPVPGVGVRACAVGGHGVPALIRVD